MDTRDRNDTAWYYFPERGEVLYLYMGYPAARQPWPHSPYGSAIGAAVRREGETVARKLGVVRPPSSQAGHWAAGYLGGAQLLPGRNHSWDILLNGSPTAPDPHGEARWREEPPPSLGGFAVCDEAWPVQGWHFLDAPLEFIADLPREAVVWGEGTNLWRHHLLRRTGEPDILLYNSGAYGQEQIYAKRAEGSADVPEPPVY